MEEALEAARRIGDEESSANALAELALQLANAGRVQEALGAVRGIGDEESRANSPAAPDQVESFLEAVERIGAKSLRADNLAALALRLAKAGLREGALEVARNIQDESVRASAWRHRVRSRRRWKWREGSRLTGRGLVPSPRSVI